MSPSIYQPLGSSAKKCCAMAADANANQAGEAMYYYVSCQLSLVLIASCAHFKGDREKLYSYRARCVSFLDDLFVIVDIKFGGVGGERRVTWDLHQPSCG